MKNLVPFRAAKLPDEVVYEPRVVPPNSSGNVVRIEDHRKTEEIHHHHHHHVTNNYHDTSPGIAREPIYIVDKRPNPIVGAVDNAFTLVAVIFGLLILLSICAR